MATQVDPIKAVIFDLDGTLIDSEPSAVEAVSRCFRSWGIQIDPNDATYITGRTWAQAFSFLFQKYPIPVGQDLAIQQVLERYRESLEEKLHAVPGSVEAVQSIAQGYKLGLVSGSHRAEILWALRKLGIEDLFQIILGAEDYPRSKPEPDGYLKAMEILQVQPNETLVFEDSQAGISSARMAGAWCVAIRATNHFQQDTSQAHHAIEDLRAVNREWVSDFSRRLMQRN